MWKHLCIPGQNLLHQIILLIYICIQCANVNLRPFSVFSIAAILLYLPLFEYGLIEDSKHILFNYKCPSPHITPSYILDTKTMPIFVFWIPALKSQFCCLLMIWTGHLISVCLPFVKYSIISLRGLYKDKMKEYM